MPSPSSIRKLADFQSPNKTNSVNINNELKIKKSNINKNINNDSDSNDDDDDEEDFSINSSLITKSSINLLSVSAKITNSSSKTPEMTSVKKKKVTPIKDGMAKCLGNIFYFILHYFYI
jgi:hypothetical protein